MAKTLNEAIAVLTQRAAWVLEQQNGHLHNMEPGLCKLVAKRIVIELLGPGVRPELEAIVTLFDPPELRTESAPRPERRRAGESTLPGPGRDGHG